MKVTILFLLVVFSFLTSFAQSLKVIERTFVDRSPAAKIILLADTTIVTETLDSSKFALVNNSGEKVYCKKIQVTANRINLIFPINSANFVIFERLVSDSTGYSLENNEEIKLTNGSIGVGELVSATKDNIRRIPEQS